MSNSATPWTVACHSPLSMGFSRQEYRSGLSFPPPGDLPNPGLKPGSPALAGRFFTVWVTREALYIILQLKKKERNQKKRDRAFGWDIIACEAEWRPWGSRRAFSCPRILLHHFHRTHKRVAAPESRVIHKGGGASHQEVLSKDEDKTYVLCFSTWISWMPLQTALLPGGTLVPL